MSSQVPYLEHHVGPPHVITLDITDRVEVEQVLHDTVQTKVR